MNLDCALHIGRIMDGKVKLALVGAGMFGGDVHLRAYADLQRSGISPQLGRVGLDQWSRDLAPVQFELVAIAARTENSARRSAEDFKNRTGQLPRAYFGETPWIDLLRDIPDLDALAIATPDICIPR